MERTKSPWDIHLQLMRIEKEYRRIRVYKPYTAMLLLNMANDIGCSYANNFASHGIDIDRERFTKFPRIIYTQRKED